MSSTERIIKIWEARLASKTLNIKSVFSFTLNTDESKNDFSVFKEEEISGFTEEDSKKPCFRLYYCGLSYRLEYTEELESLYKITKAIFEEQVSQLIEAELTDRGL